MFIPDIIKLLTKKTSPAANWFPLENVWYKIFLSFLFFLVFSICKIKPSKNKHVLKVVVNWIRKLRKKILPMECYRKVINQDYWRLNSISYLLLVTKRIETKTKKYGNFARSTWNVGFFYPVRSFWMNQQKCIQITIKQPTTLTDEWEEEKLDTNSWLFPFSM